MTICLAALCDNGESCVVAADRMAVFGAGSLLEFKQDDATKKIYKIADCSVLLHSGATQDAEAIAAKMLNDATEDLRQRLDQVVAELLREQRDLKLSRLIGGDFNYEKLIAAVCAAPSGPFQEAWQQVKTINLGDMLLVAPEKSGYAIHWLRPPEFGAKADLHYASVGSGGIYGRAALTIQQYAESSKISEALFQVYSAKKAAEMVYGVGEPTDMAVLTKGRVIDVSPETIGLLEKLRRERSKYLLTPEQSEGLRESLGLR
jgi:hypothetical protein